MSIPPRGAVGAVQVEARNRGDHPIRATSAGFEVQDGSGNVAAIIHQPPAATIPGVIQPRDSAFTYLLENELGPLDPTRPLVGWVTLSTGERIHSEPTTLMRR
jgi:hypothetical protein